MDKRRTPPQGKPSDVLPTKWVATTIGQIAELNPGWSTPSISDDTLVSFVPMSAVEAITGRLDPSIHRPWREVKSGFTRFEDDDVLFAKITPSMENGKIAVARNLIGGRGVGSTELHVLRARAGVLPKFLLYFLLRNAFRREARTQMRGVAGQQRVPADFISRFPISIPSIAEQQSLIDQIDERLIGLEAIQSTLIRTQSNLRHLRDSLISVALTGRLVPTEAELARAADQEYESGSQLLSRLRVGFRTEHQRAPSDAELPEGWSWALLEDIAEIKAGITKGLKRRPGQHLRPVPYLRVANVQRGYLDLRELKTIEATDEEVAELRLSPGDMLLNEGGDRDKLGRGWLWQGEAPECIFQNHVFRARPRLAELEPKFFSWYANTFGQAYFFNHAKQTTNLASINQTKLRALPVPVPPLREQSRIVTELERLLSITERVSDGVNANVLRTKGVHEEILEPVAGVTARPKSPEAEESRPRRKGGSDDLKQPCDSAVNKSKSEVTTMASARSHEEQTDPWTMLTMIAQAGGGSATPSESLLDLCGYTEDTIDEFYNELKQQILSGRVVETRGPGGILLSLP